MEDKRVSEKVVIASGQYLKEKNYWLKQMQGDFVKSCFPSDYKKEKGENEVSRGKIKFSIQGELFTRLTRISSDVDPMLYVILAAGLVLLLYKYTGNRDVVVGTAIDKQEADGELINTVLPLRNRLNRRMTFKDLLLHVRETIVKAIENRNYPIAALLSQLDPGGYNGNDKDEYPLFDVAVLLESIHDKRYLEPLNLGMVFSFTKRREFLQGVVEYNPLRYEGTTAARIIAHYRYLLQQVVSFSHLRLDDLDLLPGEEKIKLLNEFNNTTTAYPKEKTLHCLFTEQEEKKPDRIALIGVNSSQSEIQNREQKLVHLTYRELSNQSHRTAGLLGEKAVQPDNIVGIMVERSIEMIVGILGILKSGGAYLPIDLECPTARINYMLSDSQAKILLTTKARAKTINFDKEIVYLDCSSPRTSLNLSAGRRFNSHPSASINHNSKSLAYVIYTSGTTGKPKGTLTTHANVIRVVKNTNYINLTVKDRLLQLSNYSFDGSTFDIYGALLNQAALVMIKKENLLSLDRLFRTITREAITVFFVTTALFNSLVDLKIDCFDNIRKVLFGGELVSVVHTRKALEYVGKDRMIHVYGPTETTVYASYYFIDHIDEWAATIPIGKPLANTTSYILDENMDPVALGVIGEIYIGGDGVARGYLNRPELTAEKFKRAVLRHSSFVIGNSSKTTDLPAGFFPGNRCPMTNDRLYRTGDLGRWLPEGNIEFFGRIDQQVKIRGFRIELGEIEYQLLQHDKINEVVVLAREDRGSKYLCAYVVSKVSAKEIKGKELRDFLADKLPDYMIPSYFVPLERLPLTPNGKVAKKELPLPQDQPGQDYEAPHNEIERELVKIWSEILGVEPIGITANFFEIGGDSIKAIQISARLRKIGFKVEITEIFLYPTIKELAACVKPIRRTIHGNPPVFQKISAIGNLQCIADILFH